MKRADSLYIANLVVMLVGFVAFVFAGTIAAVDSVDYYDQTTSIHRDLTRARLAVEKIPADAKATLDNSEVQAALAKIESATAAIAKLEQTYHPEAKQLEEVYQRHMISTVTTRVSAASLLAFLAALLANLYRHNIRLSAFYSSRVDALRLSKQPGLSAFERLSKGLLPDGLDPGKGPDTPAKQAVEFAKTIAKATRSESKAAKAAA